MTQTISITEARDNFPALVRQIAEQAKTVVVTSRNQPRVVLMPWETYQQQQDLQSEGAEYRLQRLVTVLERTAAGLSEAFDPNSLDLPQGIQDLAIVARDVWTTCRLLAAPRRHLSSLLTDALLNVSQSGVQVNEMQLQQLLAILPLLRQPDLTNEAVRQADLALAVVGLHTIIPIGDELVASYQAEGENRV